MTAEPSRGTTGSERLRESLDARMKMHGMSLWGVADLDTARRSEEMRGCVPDDLCGGYSRAVVMGVRLQDAVLEGIEDRPTPLYFHHYRQANFFLDRVAFDIARLLQDAGHSALAIPATQIITRKPMRGHACHRSLGWAAGLGWRGRNNLLVHPEYGSRVRYVSVLTDAPLDAGTPMSGGCGDCFECVKACPAGAIHASAEDFDIVACKAKLDEFARLPFVGQHICGVCVKACRGKGKM